jgi:hypothetical protein
MANLSNLQYLRQGTSNPFKTDPKLASGSNWGKRQLDWLGVDCEEGCEPVDLLPAEWSKLNSSGKLFTDLSSNLHLPWSDIVSGGYGNERYYEFYHSLEQLGRKPVEAATHLESSSQPGTPQGIDEEESECDRGAEVEDDSEAEVEGDSGAEVEDDEDALGQTAKRGRSSLSSTSQDQSEPSLPATPSNRVSKRQRNDSPTALPPSSPPIPAASISSPSSESNAPPRSTPSLPPVPSGTIHQIGQSIASSPPAPSSSSYQPSTSSPPRVRGSSPEDKDEGNVDATVKAFLVVIKRAIGLVNNSVEIGVQ